VIAKVQAYELKGLRKATSAYKQNPSLYFAKSTKTKPAYIGSTVREVRSEESREKRSSDIQLEVLGLMVGVRHLIRLNLINWRIRLHYYLLLWDHTKILPKERLLH
jgi:hypothetical protein